MDRALSIVIKTAVAVLAVKIVHQEVSPYWERWRRRRRLRQEKRAIERKLKIVTDDDRIDRLERIYEAMNAERIRVGLDPHNN